MKKIFHIILILLFTLSLTVDVSAQDFDQIVTNISIFEVPDDPGHVSICWDSNIEYAELKNIPIRGFAIHYKKDTKLQTTSDDADSLAEFAYSGTLEAARVTAAREYCMNIDGLEFNTKYYFAIVPFIHATPHGTSDAYAYQVPLVTTINETKQLRKDAIHAVMNTLEVSLDAASPHNTIDVCFENKAYDSEVEQYLILSNQKEPIQVAEPPISRSWNGGQIIKEFVFSGGDAEYQVGPGEYCVKFSDLRKDMQFYFLVSVLLKGDDFVDYHMPSLMDQKFAKTTSEVQQETIPEKQNDPLPAEVVNVPTAQKNSFFTDVDTDHVNADAIEHVRQSGIVNGYEDGTFQPEGLINRAEFLKIVVESNFSEDDIESCLADHTGQDWIYAFFTDVPVDSWFAKYICMGKVHNIISGYPDQTFRPDQDISFVEMAKVLFFESPPPPDPEIWYRPYVTILSQIAAIPVSISSVDKKVDRGEVAEIIFRLDAEIIGKKHRVFGNGALKISRSPIVGILEEETLRAYDAARLADVNILNSALRIYYADNGEHPEKLEELLPYYIYDIATDPESKENYMYEPFDLDGEIRACYRLSGELTSPHNIDKMKNDSGIDEDLYEVGTCEDQWVSMFE